MSAASSLINTLPRAAKYATFAALAWAIIGMWVVSHYDQRGDWYEHYAGSESLSKAVWLSTGACFFTILALVDPGQRRRPLTIFVPALVWLACVGVTAVLWVRPSPTLEGAEAAFEAGDHERAAAELDALDAAERASPTAIELRAKVEVDTEHAREERAQADAIVADDQRLFEVGRASLKIGATLVLRRTWADAEKHEAAHQQLLERAQALADDAWKRGDGAALADIATDTRGLDGPFTHQCEARAMLATARACLDAGRTDCARESLARLELGAELDAPLEAVRLELEQDVSTANE